MEVARRDVELRKDSLKTRRLTGLDSVLIHISGVDDFQDALGLGHVVLERLKEFDVRSRVVEDQHDWTRVKLSPVLLGDQTSRILDSSGNELLDLGLLDELGSAVRPVRECSN